MRTATAQPKARACPGALALAALATIAAACGSSSETITAPAQARCTIAIEPGATTFSPDGGTATLRVTTERECAWTARSEAPWITLGTPSSGQGAAAIPFTVTANEAPDIRQAAIAVNDQRQPISQQGRVCDFAVSTEHMTVAAAGGQLTIAVSANSEFCGWTASVQAAWMTITSGAEGHGNGVVTLQVAAATGPPRTGTITVAGRSVRIEQGPGCAFTVSPPALDIGAEGGNRTLRVDASSAECAWTASSNGAWLTVGLGAGATGSGTLSVRAEPSTEPERTALLTVGNGTVRVNQASGCRVVLDPPSVSVSEDSWDVSIAVQSGPKCTWTATTNQAWIVVTSGVPGMGGGRVGASIAPNIGPTRTGAVAVGGATFSVTQASGCTYRVAPSAHHLPGIGGIAGIDVSTVPGCPWTASAEAAWLSLSPEAGSGPGTVRVAAQPNGMTARTSTVVVAGQTVTISQGPR